jgi:serine protease
MKKIQKILSILLVFSLMLLPYGSLAAIASGEKPSTYHAFGKGSANFAHDEILVKFAKDSEPFRIIKVPEGKVAEKVHEYARRPDVVYAEPNYVAQAFYTPNDTYYSYQWNFGAVENHGIGMEKAWDVSQGAPDVVVAIVDTGIAYETTSVYAIAPDLSGATFVQGYDFVNNDSHPNDDNSHGTHVAGTVAQQTGNGIGTAGVAFQTALMPVKVLDKQGSGTYSNIAKGIRYAADYGAQVINLSLGGALPSTTLEEALAYAYNKGVTIVAAAGNDGLGIISYPAAYDDYVIAVGATRFDGTRAYYSNYGNSLDLMAPGGDINVDQNGDGAGDGILQNTFDPNTKNPKTFGYWLFQGTSMASPHVAGVAALLIAHGNAKTPDDIRSAIQETAMDLGSKVGWEAGYGWGLLDAAAALQWYSAANAAPVADSQSLSTDQDKSLAITLTASDPDGDPLEYTVKTGPTGGTLTGAAPNLTYTPNPGFFGTDQFTFIANDGSLDSNEAVIEITVNEVPVQQDIDVIVSVDTEYKVVRKSTYFRGVATVAVEGSPAARVEGHWSGSASDLDSEIKEAEKDLILYSDFVKKNKSALTFTFTVDRVTIDDVAYKPTGQTFASVTVK